MNGIHRFMRTLSTNAGTALRLAILPAVLYFFFAGCAASTPPVRSVAVPDTAWADNTLRGLSLEEKVAQMIVVWTPGRYYARDAEEWRTLEHLVAQRKIGGLVFSIGDVYEYAVQINRLQRMARTPLLVAGDFEYGAAMRVRYATAFPTAMAVGATRDTGFAYRIGLATAREGRALGVQQNYAPTVDINLNPMNPVINTRSFGDHPDLVAAMGDAFVRGTMDGGMLPTVKHFPGHGDTEVDSHLGLSVLNFSRARFDSVELVPYRDVFRLHGLSVMVGHLSVPMEDSVTGIPATLSPNVSTRLLREEMGFMGLVVSDALQMRAVAAHYQPGEAAVLAVKAGMDLVLMPVDPDVAIDAIAAAVRRGEIPESRIDASVRRILAVKQQFGLDRVREVNIDSVASVVGCRAHEDLALDVARKAVTVLGNESKVLPLPAVDRRSVLDLVITDMDDPSTGRSFHDLLRDRHPGAQYVRLDASSNRLDCDSALAKAQRADVLVIQFHFVMRSGQMTGFFKREHCDIINKLFEQRKPTIGISFGNPYVAMNFPTMDAYVCGYGNSDAIQRSTAEILFGQTSPTGRLPITIPGRYAFGDGVTYPAICLRDGSPEDAGLDPTRLDAVDGIVDRAIADSAFPGAVLLVARNGIVVHDKAYGAQTYDPYSPRITPNTMYDLASVTKVIATTSAVMRLLDEHRIDLSDRVVKYLPPFGQQGKERITLYNLMVHNAGLPAWRKFYEFCDNPQCVMDSIFATPLIYRTGDSTVYSDLGLITMGKIIEKVTGTTLDRYVDSVFFRPLGMTSTMYNPPASLLGRIAPTEIDTYWKKTGVAVHGRVHDENAATLGGVSGHAGLFSTASDLAILLQMLLNGGTYDGVRYLNQATVERFTTRQADGSSRGIGWDTKSSEHSFSGTLTSMKTFLHTGFTGTSVVVDPVKRLIVVFLTNRVYPTRENMKIGRVRPAVHNAILSAIEPGE